MQTHVPFNLYLPTPATFPFYHPFLQRSEARKCLFSLTGHFCQKCGVTNLT